MLLDRLLDSVGLEVTPLAMCDVRSGVRVELPGPSELHMHCIVEGAGLLGTARGFSAVLARCTLALIPADIAHRLEPLGGTTHVLSMEPALRSDHVPKLIAGSGEPGLLVVSGRIRATVPGVPGLFDGLADPLVVDLAQVPGVPAVFEALRIELEQRLPANRRMAGLLLHQCLVHGVRKLWGNAESPLRRFGVQAPTNATS